MGMFDSLKINKLLKYTSFGVVQMKYGEWLVNGGDENDLKYIYFSFDYDCRKLDEIAELIENKGVILNEKQQASYDEYYANYEKYYALLFTPDGERKLKLG